MALALLERISLFSMRGVYGSARRQKQNKTKMKKLLLTAGMCVLATFGAKAATYNLADFNSHDVGVGSPYTGSFNLLSAPGYNPGGESIISAMAGFTIIDPNGFFGGPEEVTITLDGNFFASANNFSAVSLGGSVNIAYLADDVLSFTITSTPGSVPSRLTLAALQWTTGPKTQPPSVPDGGSMMALFGLSVLGLGWAGRRIRA